MNLSPRATKCQLCERPFKKGDKVVDGATIGGQWCFMCVYCWSDNGVETGVGRAQIFDFETKRKVS
jgi:hypothetical protein